MKCLEWCTAHSAQYILIVIIVAVDVIVTRLGLPILPLSKHSSVHSTVQLLSRVRLFATPGITARQASLSITNSRSSLTLTSIESVIPSSHLILGRPLLLLPPIAPSIRVFSNESTLCMRWPKYWSFSTDFRAQKKTSATVSPRICHEIMGMHAMILVFWMMSFKPTFSLVHLFQSHCSAFIRIWDLNPEKNKSIVDFEFFTSRWIDDIQKN